MNLNALFPSNLVGSILTAVVIALVTWLVYTLYWHLHRRPGWPGRRIAWLAAAGLATVLFTFLGVGWLARSTGLQSLHLF